MLCFMSLSRCASPARTSRTIAMTMGQLPTEAKRFSHQRRRQLVD